MRYNILIIVFNLLISYNLNSEHTDNKKQNQNNNIIYFEKSDYGIIFEMKGENKEEPAAIFLREKFVARKEFAINLHPRKI